MEGERVAAETRGERRDERLPRLAAVHGAVVRCRRGEDEGLREGLRSGKHFERSNRVVEEGRVSRSASHDPQTACPSTVAAVSCSDRLHSRPLVSPSPDDYVLPLLPVIAFSFLHPILLRKGETHNLLIPRVLNQHISLPLGYAANDVPFVTLVGRAPDVAADLVVVEDGLFRGFQEEMGEWKR